MTAEAAVSTVENSGDQQQALADDPKIDNNNRTTTTKIVGSNVDGRAKNRVLRPKTVLDHGASPGCLLYACKCLMRLKCVDDPHQKHWR